ncbi:prepilin-type N-terminal cleavage/methylation domain-containing protein [Sporosarcina sp. A2]|uniref:prepilin-type N-terminal cleavage/methylation domain-containing protein n=1 Tax=Sporosarcina sp. A2 TaxID=3393449 RepID=UPI003D792B60
MYLRRRIQPNEAGMTLVELLAVLVLISLVTGIIWTTMSISMKHNKVETSKLQLQQEANLIITKLQNIHRENDCYLLTVDDDLMEISPCSNKVKPSREIISNDYTYKVEVEGAKIGTRIFEVLPKNKDLIFKSLIVETKHVPNSKDSYLTVNVPTTISRYKNIKEDGNETN